jgi:large repetitive protein
MCFLIKKNIFSHNFQIVLSLLYVTICIFVRKSTCPKAVTLSEKEKMKYIIRFFLIFVLIILSSPAIFSQLDIVSVTSTPAICNGSNSGSITFTITGGVKPYYYQISKPGYSVMSDPVLDTFHTFNNVPQGNYISTVFDFDGFWDQTAVVVSQPPKISVSSVSVTPVSCNGLNDGEISVSASGESGSYTFLLRPDNSTTSSGIFTNLIPGNYRVVVSDATGCLSKDSTAILTVSEPAAISITSQSSINVSCNGAGNGSISVLAAGGTGALSYTLNPGSITQANGLFTGLIPDTYTVTVTDQFSCAPAVSSNITISEPLPLQYNLQSSTNVSCNGTANGSITVTASGGTAPYTFTLSPGGASNATGIFTGLAPNTYTVSLTDSRSCGPVASNNFIITQPAVISISNTVVTQISCHNSNNGQIQVTAAGGNAPLTYTLNPGALSNTTGLFTSLAGGNYTVTVSDPLGCPTVSTPSISIVNPAAISINSEAFTTITCSGQSNGTISVTASGGTGALSYTLNPGGVTQANGNFTALSANTYTVSVTDQNSCPAAVSSSIIISEPLPLQYNLQSSTNVSCNGAANGSITVTASGGTAPYTFTLSPGGTSNATGIFTGLAPNTYTVSLTDSRSCGPVASNNFIITQPAVISISNTVVTQISCHNSNNGQIQVTAAGGNAPLTYTLNPGALSNTTGLFTSLAGGNYTVTVSDPLGCPTVSTPSISIVNPAAISINSEAFTTITCSGQSNGTISVTASGGTGALSYTLNPGGITQANGNYTALSANTYTVSVTDQNSCPAAVSSSIIISEPLPLQYNLQSSTNVSCNGAANGSITVTASGGTAPYTFTLSPGGASNATGIFTGLAPNTYTVSLTDSRSCGPVASNNFIITQPAVISISNTVVTQISCHNSNNGQIQVSAAGGNAPLTYTLNPGALSNTTGLFTSLAGGNYTVTVSDPLGCPTVSTPSISIVNPAAISINSEAFTTITCSGQSNGTISVTASGGTGALSYTLNPGGVTQANGNFTALSANTYTVSVTDQNSCPAAVSSSIIISEPLPLQYNLQSSTNVSCNGAANGSITVTASGGTAPYTFTLSPGGASNATGIFTGLAPNTYTVSLTDSRSCGPVASNNFIITQPAVISISNTVVTQISCHNSNNGQIQVSAAGGNAPLTYTLNPGALSNTTGLFTSLAGGNYTVTVSDPLGCPTVSTPSISIVNPAAISINSEAFTTITCSGQSNGTISVTASGGTGALSYTLNPGGVTQANGNFTALSANTYTVSVSDQNACPAAVSSSIIITEPLPISVTVDPSSVLSVSCFGSSDASINVNVSGGTSPYTYSWTGPGSYTSSSKDIALLGAGVYNLTITDMNLCSSINISIATVTEPEAIDISLSKTNINCNSDNNGSIVVTATGGTRPFQYSLNGIVYQADSIFNGLAENTYTVWVRDANLCLANDTISVVEPLELLINSGIGISENFCFDETNGQIRILSVSGGTAPYEYSINNGITFSDSPDFYNLPAGSYQTFVRDSRGCLSPPGTNYIISQPTEIKIITYAQLDVTGCFSSLNGQIAISASGGTGTKRYSLDGGPTNTTGSFLNVSGGSHQIIITDNNNCIKDTTVFINYPVPVEFSSLILTDVTGCHGGSNGMISGLASGGTGSYQYRINAGSYQVSGDFSGLTGGAYLFEARDGNNCVIDTSINLNQPEILDFDDIIITKIGCLGIDDGKIEVIAQGGNAPYTYTLNPGGISNGTGVFTGLSQGFYTVNLNDNNACGPVTSSSLEISQSDPMLIDSVVQVLITCFR